jgi:hypothetical protein
MDSAGWEYGALVLREILDDLTCSAARANEAWDQGTRGEIALRNDKGFDLRMRVRNEQTARVEEGCDGRDVLVHEDREARGHSSRDLASQISGPFVVVEDDSRAESVTGKEVTAGWIDKEAPEALGGGGGSEQVLVKGLRVGGSSRRSRSYRGRTGTVIGSWVGNGACREGDDNGFEESRHVASVDLDQRRRQYICGDV